MSSESNESTAHIWPLLALRCITWTISTNWFCVCVSVLILPLLLIFNLVLCTRLPHFSSFLSFPSFHHKASFPPPHSSASLPFLYAAVTSSAVGDWRDAAREASPLLSDRPQSQSVPLSGAEVYTHGKLIPVPCLPHIAFMSKVGRRAKGGVTFSKDRFTVRSHYALKQHKQRRKQWAAKSKWKYLDNRIKRG